MTADPSIADRLIRAGIYTADAATLRQALAGVLAERDRLVDLADRHDARSGRADGLRPQGLCQGQAIAYRSAAGHLEERLLSEFGLWPAYEEAEGVIERPG